MGISKSYLKDKFQKKKYADGGTDPVKYGLVEAPKTPVAKGPKYVTDPNDPSLKRYNTLKRLYEISNLPSYVEKSRLLGDLDWILPLSDPDYTNYIKSFQASIAEHDLEAEKSGRRTWKSWDTEGPYGSAVNYRKLLNKAALANPSLVGGTYAPNYFMERKSYLDLIKDYPPNYYLGKETYTGDIFARTYASALPYSYFGKPGYNFWTKPNTLFIEDSINRGLLKSIYPKLSDAKINEYVESERNNPTYVSNVAYGTGYYNINPEDNTSVSSRIIGPKDFFNFSEASDSYDKKLLGKEVYLPESVTHSINKEGRYLPMWDKPTEEVILQSSVSPPPPPPAAIPAEPYLIRPFNSLYGDDKIRAIVKYGDPSKVPTIGVDLLQLRREYPDVNKYRNTEKPKTAEVKKYGGTIKSKLKTSYKNKRG